MVLSHTAQKTLIINRIGKGGNAIASIHLSVHLSICFHSVFVTKWLLTLNFCVWVDNDHSLQGIEGQSHRSSSRSWVRLMRSVRPLLRAVYYSLCLLLVCCGWRVIAACTAGPHWQSILLSHRTSDSWKSPNKGKYDVHHSGAPGIVHHIGLLLGSVGFRLGLWWWLGLGLGMGLAIWWIIPIAPLTGLSVLLFWWKNTYFLWCCYLAVFL